MQESTQHETTRDRLINRLRFIAGVKPSGRVSPTSIVKTMSLQDCLDLEQAAALLEVSQDCGHCFNVARLKGLTHE